MTGDFDVELTMTFSGRIDPEIMGENVAAIGFRNTSYDYVNGDKTVVIRGVFRLTGTATPRKMHDYFATHIWPAFEITSRWHDRTMYEQAFTSGG